MAEKISGLIALGTIAVLLCVFVPAAPYVLRRAMSRRLHGGYAGSDLVALCAVVTALGAMLYIAVDVQQLYPRCGMYDENAEPLCFVDRYDTTVPVVAVSRDEAAARMRFDLLANVARCIIVPSVLGIATLFVLARASTNAQQDRTSDSRRF